MDLLYSRYSNPLEFMKMYIDQGRFGEFVENIIDMENKRRQEEASKEDEQKMWMMYVHSSSDKCFSEWKNEVLHQPQKEADGNQQKPKGLSMTDEEVKNQIDSAKNILKGFNMK